MAKRRQRKVSRSSKRTTAAKLNGKARKAKDLEAKKERARRQKAEQVRKSNEGMALSGYANR